MRIFCFFKLLAATFLGIILLAGCAMTSEPPSESLLPVPEDRIYFRSQNKENLVKVKFTRDISLMGMGGDKFWYLFIDNVKAAAIGQAEVASFELPAGSYLLGIRRLGRTEEFLVDHKFEMGNIYKYRLFIDGDTANTRFKRVVIPEISK